MSPKSEPNVMVAVTVVYTVSVLRRMTIVVGVVMLILSLPFPTVRMENRLLMTVKTMIQQSGNIINGKVFSVSVVSKGVTSSVE